MRARAGIVLIAGVIAASLACTDDPSLPGADGTSVFSIPDQTTGPVIIVCEEDAGLGELIICAEDYRPWRQIFAANDTLYWLTAYAAENEGIWAAPMSGADEPSPVLPAGLGDPSMMLVKGDYVYWVRFSQGGRQALASDDAASYGFIADPNWYWDVDDSDLYFGTTNGIGSVPLTGGTATFVLSDIEIDPYGVLVRVDNLLIWSSGSPNDPSSLGKLWRAELDTPAPPTTFATGLAAKPSSNMVVSGDYLYWAAAGEEFGGLIHRTARTADGPVETLAETESQSPEYIAANSTHVFWVRGDRLTRASIADGTVESLAEADRADTTIAADEQYAYWYANNGYRRFPLP